MVRMLAGSAVPSSTSRSGAGRSPLLCPRPGKKLTGSESSISPALSSRNSSCGTSLAPCCGQGGANGTEPDDERRSALRQGSGHSETGYRITMNVGHDAGQVVAHLHLHLLGGVAS